MGCCGKQRKRFLTNVKKAQDNIISGEVKEIKPLTEMEDSTLTPRQLRIKRRMLRIQRRQARAARAARAESQEQEAKSKDNL